MADILTEIDRLVDRLSTEFNTTNSLRGDLTTLTTTQKNSLVNAINELKSTLDSVDPTSIINDFTNTATNEVWSAAKSKTYSDGLITDLFAGVPPSYDSLLKITNELTAILTDLGTKVSYDADDSKTPIEKQRARTNIDAASSTDITNVNTSISNLSTDIGDTNFDFVTYFESNLT